jgi:hypothetical protein
VLAWVSLIACILTYTVHWEWDEKHHPHWDNHDYRHAMTTVSIQLYADVNAHNTVHTLSQSTTPRADAFIVNGHSRGR